ncbi:hypothetical protein FA13DRAFT_920107 [Coprinellus micaceus]|uniref:Uncharacterized protein n=1 Tax=Coprinellus micaceus TaxID=71717 RepID=A0A4Y7TTR8_COPMI|nr:hypothetical protein FA13DRAFT_920107 [Coprinellus micaceus]
MSDPLQPWIEKYLRGIAETHGGDLVALKWCDKSEKGQVIRLLTDAQKDAIFWGMLSDGEYSVPLKIMKDAVVEDRQLHDGALYENSIISVQKFKVVSARVPLGNNSGLGKTPRVVIECAAFGRSARNVHTKILGCPKLITSHEDFKLWEEGLDKGGGAGNSPQAQERGSIHRPTQSNASTTYYR